MGRRQVSPARHKDDQQIWARDLMSVYAVRRMLGRALREDRKPITRHTLLNWRNKEGFPDPVNAPSAGVELWSKPIVRAWLESRRPKDTEE
jgi:hypothetical protein